MKFRYTTEKLVMVAAILIFSDLSAEDYIGYKGDGSGVFEKANPPVEWDDNTGKGIKWKVPLPNFGCSSPIVVGDKVFVLSEPGWKTDFPILEARDINNGKVLWSYELNHLPAVGLSSSEYNEILKTWHEALDRYRRLYRIFNIYTYESKEKAMEMFEKEGYKYGGWKGGGYGQLRYLKPIDANKAKEEEKLLKKAGLTFETWFHNCGMGVHGVGQAYATPVSDGQRIYIATSFNGFFCFDLNGKLLWMKFVPGEFGEYCRNGRSPLLYKNLFISDITGIVRAFDKDTGKLLWSHKVDTETIMTPVIINVKGVDILLCFNKKAFRLPDGKELTVEEGTDFGATALVKRDERDIVFFTGGGEHGGWTNKGNCPTPPPSAVKFSLEGEKLIGKVLWAGIEGEVVCSHTQIVYYDGKLYHGGGAIIDALTGKIIKGFVRTKTRRQGTRAVPETKHLLLIGGKYIYGFASEGGREGAEPQQGWCTVYSLDGEFISKNIFNNAPVEGEKKEQIIALNGWNTWDFSYGCPFTISGNSLYFRSNDYLYRVSK